MYIKSNANHQNLQNIINHSKWVIQPSLLHDNSGVDKDVHRTWVNHSIVAFSSWSMLYQNKRHRKSYKFKTLCQKLASVFVLPVAQTRNCRRNNQIFTSSRKTLKMTFFHRYVLHFKNYLF